MVTRAEAILIPSKRAGQQSKQANKASNGVQFHYDCAADVDFPMTVRDDYSADQLRAIKHGAADNGVQFVDYSFHGPHLLQAIWNPRDGTPHKTPDESDAFIGDEDCEFCYDLPEEPNTTFGMSVQFKTDITNIDKKLQGRILVAIREILEAPRGTR